MKETQNKNYKAGAIPTGLTRKEKRPQKLYDLGRNLSLSKDDIDKTLKKKKVIQTYMMILLAGLLIGYSYMINASPAHYRGASIQDFDFFARMMYNVFGRII